MAKFEKTITTLTELKHSQEGYLQKAKDKGNEGQALKIEGRVKALATAIRVLIRRRAVILGHD